MTFSPSLVVPNSDKSKVEICIALSSFTILINLLINTVCKGFLVHYGPVNIDGIKYWTYKNIFPVKYWTYITLLSMNIALYLERRPRKAILITSVPSYNQILDLHNFTIHEYQVKLRCIWREDQGKPYWQVFHLTIIWVAKHFFLVKYKFKNLKKKKPNLPPFVRKSN